MFDLFGPSRAEWAAACRGRQHAWIERELATFDARQAALPSCCRMSPSSTERADYFAALHSRARDIDDSMSEDAIGWIYDAHVAAGALDKIAAAMG